MRLLIEIGYCKMLLGPGANVSAIVASLDGAKQVKQVGGWQEPKRYEPEGDQEIGVTLVPDDSLSMPENADKDLFENWRKLANERDDLQKKVRELESKIEETKKAVGADEKKSS